MNNYSSMMKQAQKMQNDMMKAQEKLASMPIEASAGGGMVKVFGTGGGKITEIKVNPEVVDPDDVEFLEDLLLAAVNKFHEDVEALTNQHMGPLAGGLGGLL